MKSCPQWAPLLALAPDEMTDPTLVEPLALHLASCPDCCARQAVHACVRAATAQTASRYPAPPALRARILDALCAADAPAVPVAPAGASGGTGRVPGRGDWALLAGGWMAAGALTFALLASVVLRPLSWPASTDVREAARADALAVYIDNHARALVTNHLIDVASSDRHTVKPWFRGRLDFSPPVVDLHEQGYPLLGGRLDYVRQRSLAVLVYQRRQHVIDVYLWPESAGSAVPATETRGALGYNSVQGAAAGVGFAAVSDLDPVELREMARLFGQGLQAQAGNGMPQ